MGKGWQTARSIFCSLFHTSKEGSAHLHLIAVEEVDVRFVLLRILTHQEEDGGIAHLIQHRLAVLDCRQREVLQLLLEEKEEGVRQGETIELTQNGPVYELLGSLFEERDLAELGFSAVVCWALQRYMSGFAEGQWLGTVK